MLYCRSGLIYRTHCFLIISCWIISVQRRSAFISSSCPNAKDALSHLRIVVKDDHACFELLFCHERQSLIWVFFVSQGWPLCFYVPLICLWTLLFYFPSFKLWRYVFFSFVSHLEMRECALFARIEHPSWYSSYFRSLTYTLITDNNVILWKVCYNSQSQDVLNIYGKW